MLFYADKYELVTSADFAERFKLEFNYEIQPMHWYSTTCSIYVVIVYLPPAPGCSEKRVESFFFVSDEPKQVWAAGNGLCIALPWDHL